MATSGSTPGAAKSRGIGWRIACLLLSYVAIAALCNAAWHLLGLPPQMRHGVLDPGLMFLTSVILVGAVLAASALTLRLFERRPLATIGVPVSGPWVPQLLIGLIFGAMVPIAFFLIAWKSGHAHVSRVAVDAHYILRQTLPAFGAFLLLAFNEELLFRGYLLQAIAQRGGRHAAALITGALFGLAHAASGADVAGIGFTALGGALLAYLIMRNGSLWMAGGYHAAWNATASLALGLDVSGTATPGSWIATAISGPRWFSGGAYGFESSLITGLAEPIVLGGLVWLAPRLPVHRELLAFFERKPPGTQESSA